ncbi:MAG: hypothetical protein MUP09_07120 [Thiovulaceae bacterium]|nr:hypothetical protein [Sulfurimonadaceae bacterium]
MKRAAMLVASMLLMTKLYANNGFGSEFSHFVGGAATAGGITAVVDHYYPQYQEDRGMIGFGISSVAIVLEQSVEYALYGDARGQLLDAVSHVAGAAVGSWVTDQYILSPVIHYSSTEGKYVGVALQHSF